MLWASTGTKDPKAPPGLYVEALAAPGHHRYHAGEDPAGVRRRAASSSGVMRDGRRRCRGGAGAIRRAPASTSTRSPRNLQVDGAESFVKSWSELMQRIADKSAALATS